jgi:hypothetical protein
MRIRQVAVHCLKNVVTRFWRPRSDVFVSHSLIYFTYYIHDLKILLSCRLISNEEKSNFRARLIQLLPEPNDIIATQICVLIAQIARLDWPRFWSDLFPTFFSLFQASSGLPRYRVLQAMRHTLQSLASRTLSADRRQLAALTTTLFEAVASLWSSGNDMILHALSEYANQRASVEQIQGIELDAVVTLEALRVLHLLFMYGFESWKVDSPPMACLRLILDRYAVCVQARDSLGQINPLAKFTRKYIKAFGRLHLDILEKNAASYAPLVPAALEFSFNAVAIQTAASLKWEKFIVDNMLFMEKCMDSKMGPYKEGTAGAAIVDSFFSVERQKQLIQVIMTQLFPLTAKDLEEWENDPEEFIHDAGTDAATEKYRPCAENLFLVLLNRNQTVLGPWVVSVLQQVSQMPPNSLDAILAKDACYNAVARSCWELPPYINFAEWFQSTLQAELNMDRQNPTSPWRIIRRRIGDLLGMWVATHSMAMKPAVYAALNDLMQDPDMVVAFTATQSVNYVIGDTSFTADDFLPYLDTAVRCLFNIVQRAEYVDTKLRVMPALRTTIEQVGDRIGPYADGIVTMLGNMWNSAECTAFLRQATIRTLTKIVDAVGDSSRFAAFFYHVVDYSVSLSSEDILYVLEDGLDLWIAVVNNATVFTPELLQLFPKVLAIINQSVTLIDRCMKVVEAYILLGRSDFLQVYMADLGRLFAKLASDLLDDAISYLLKPLETLIMLYPQEAVPMLQDTFNCMLQHVLEASLTERTITYFLAVFGRVLLHNQPFFLGWFKSLKSPDPSQNVMKMLLQKWVSSFEPMPDLRRRKMSALALISLLGVPEFTSSFAEEAALILQESIGVCLDELEGPGPEYRVRADAVESDDDAILDLPSLSSVGIQTRQLAFLYQNDPVNSVQLHEFIRGKIAACQQVDPQGYATMLQLIEPLVIQQFTERTQGL